MVAKGLNTPPTSTKRRDAFLPLLLLQEREKRYVYLRARMAKLIKMPSGIFATERRENVSERRKCEKSLRQRELFLTRSELSNLTPRQYCDYARETEDKSRLPV